MEKNIDNNQNSGVITTFHKKDCDDELYCKCSEEEGMNIKERYFQINGKIEGEYISYYVNGNVDNKCFYKNDKIEGEKISYYSNGNVYKKCTYQNGKIEG